MDIISKKFFNIFHNSIRSFTPALRHTYVKVLLDYKNNPDTANFEFISTEDGFENPTAIGVAHRMYWWFPTHFFKFQDAILRWEEKSQQKKHTFLLGRQQITFIDLGCGSGAASAAILSVIEHYQSFLITENIRLDPIKVNFVGIDQFQSELNNYKNLLDEYAEYLKQQKISINVQTICQSFPEVTDNLLTLLRTYQGHVLIIGMSNLINWIWNEADPYLKLKKHDSIQNLKSLETESFKKITIESNFNISCVIGIATKNRTRWWLSKKLSILFEKFIQALTFSNRIYSSFWMVNAEVLFENPEGSRRAKDKATASSRFFIETITDISPQFAKDKRYQDLLSSKSLERAWVKAQTWINYESLIDKVELKLFELDYQGELEKLKSASFEKLFDYLNINYDFPYEYPKNEKVNRPKSLARLEEQIVSVALAVEFEKEILSTTKNVSFSFQLGRKDSEFIYRYWYELYSRFINSVLNNAGNKKILTTDLRSFYVNINQDVLLQIIAKKIGFSNQSYNLFTKIINRNCHANHERGYGLLQGHSISGLLANLMLQPIDRKYLFTYEMWSKYFRFTDDVAITGDSSDNPPLETVQINNFRNLLLEHDLKLTLNEGKTKKYNNFTDYEIKVRANKDMDGVSARFNTLLLPIFVMNENYRREFSKSSLHFVYEYNELLECLGLYFSPEWLYRKLDEISTSVRLIRSSFKIISGGYSIKFPQLPTNASYQSRQEWAKEFELLNPKWITEKTTIKRVLAAMFNTSSTTLINLSANPIGDTSRLARKIKFSLNRLSIFGGGDTVNQSSWMLIHRPWDINVWLACKNLGRSKLDNELSYIVDNAKLSYVRALAIKALGTIRSPIAVKKITNVLDNGNEKIERLMASEALLEINLWNDVSYEQIINWMEKDCVDPYLHKNIILILAQAYPDKIQEYVSQLDEDLHPIVNRSVYYSITKNSSENLLWRPEPEVIRNYRAKSYPIIEELIQEEGSYKFGSP